MFTHEFTPQSNSSFFNGYLSDSLRSLWVYILKQLFTSGSVHILLNNPLDFVLGIIQQYEPRFRWIIFKGPPFKEFQRSLNKKCGTHHGIASRFLWKLLYSPSSPAKNTVEKKHFSFLIKELNSRLKDKFLIKSDIFPKWKSFTAKSCMPI